MRDETITRRTFLGAAVLAGTSAAAQKDKNVEAVGAFTFREFRVAERVGKARTLMPNNIVGTSASLGPVIAIAGDTTGNVFFSAGNYGIVLRMAATTGTLTVLAGNGIVGYSGDNGAATSAELVWPTGISVDVSGNVYIADFADNRVRKVANGVITTVAGNGTAGYSGDGFPATSAELNNPTHLAVGASGNLYIADSGNGCVRRISGGLIATVAGNGRPGFSGDGGPATLAGLSPAGIAVDAAGNLYIADGWSRVRQVSNGVITSVAGNAIQGYSGDGGPATSAELNLPLDVTVDSSGNLFIAERGNARVRKVARGVIQTVAGGGGVGDGGLATNAQLDGPFGIALGPSGVLYIADTGSNRVRSISDGVITTVGGNGTTGTSGDNGPAINAGLTPLAVAVDSSGDVYVAGDSSVRKISNGVISPVVGNGTYGADCANGPAGGALLSSPYGIALDPSGNLYIADTYNDCVRELSNGMLTTVAGIEFSPGYSGDNSPAVWAKLREPQGVALDASGNLYIADSYNNVIRRVSKGIITTVAGNGAQGYSGDNGPATSARLFVPTSIALDATGNLFIADYANNRVRKVAGGVITTIAGNGTSGFGGDNGPATAAPLDGPWGIAVDPAGSVYIADSGSNRIRMLVPSGASTCTYAVSPLLFTTTKAAASFTARVQTATGCTWAVDSLPNWMALSGNAVNTGPGGVTVNISANAGNERSVFITIARISIQVTQKGLLSINSGGVVNAASYAAAVAPGSIAAVFGDFPLTSPVTDTSLPLATMLPLPGSIWDFFLYFPSVNAPLFYASDGQVNLQVPWEFAGQAQTTLSAATGPSNVGGMPQTVSLAPFAPGIFATNSQGTGQGAILDANYHLVDAANPAPGGSTVLIFCTGLGAVTNQPPTASPASLSTRSATTTLPTVTIGGASAKVSFSGLAPGYVGLYQVNAQVPVGLATNNAVPVVISIGGAVSNTVTIAVH